MLWIFTGKGAGLDNVVLHWDTGQTADMLNQGNGSGSYHATVSFFDPTDPANLPIYVTYTGTLEGNATLTISGCNEEQGGGGPGTSNVSTVVHAGQTDGTTPVVVDNDNPAAVESYVHDSGNLTFSVAALPSGSHVTFYFFTNNTCTVPASDSTDVDVSGATSPDSLDPELAEQILAAGGYSYQAFFYSGDSGVVQDAAGDCEPFQATVQAQTSSISTEIHLGATDSGAPVVVSAPVDLGSTVHDSASLSFSGGGTLPTGSNVVFYFWKAATCDSDVSTAFAHSSSIDVSGDSSPVSLDPYLAEGPLAAGSYAYEAVFTSGDTNLVASNPSACEPFSVNQANSSTSTKVLNAANVDVTGKVVALGTTVHDTATVTGSPFTPTGTLTYTLYNNGTCDGTVLSTQTVSLSGGLVPGSNTFTIVNPGNYSYSATYNGDSNYKSSTGACEPFSGFNASLTIGYWGNHLDNTIKKGKPNAACSGLPNGTSCSTSGPYTATYLPKSLGNYSVDTILKAAQVFAANNCSNASTSNQNAIGCLSAQLLGAELNVANGGNTCINTTISQANAFLISMPKSPSGTMSYTGPSGNYSALTAAGRTTALSLQAALVKYNQFSTC